MLRKFMALFLIMALLPGCAGWTPNYEAMGKLGEDRSIEKQILPKNVEIYVQEYPKGFVYSDGVVSTTEDNKKILGEIKIEMKLPNPAVFLIVGLLTLGIGCFFMLPHGITREEAVVMLKQKASEVGANAVIGVKLPTKENNYSGASGIAVITDSID